MSALTDQEPQGEDQPPPARIDWLGQVFGHAPLHHFGHFLDRYDLAAFET